MWSLYLSELKSDIIIESMKINSLNNEDRDEGFVAKPSKSQSLKIFELNRSMI